jgi:uncharacterized membrane protein
LTRDPIYILAVLAILIAASEWLVRRTALRHVGTALLVILLTAVVANLGVIPAGSTDVAPVPVYDAIFAYVAPLAIFWLLLGCNLRSILRAGLPLIALFLIGSAGVMLGAFLGMGVFAGVRELTPLYAAVGGMFTATYTGGSINFNAVALSYEVNRDGTLFAGTVVVDNVVTTAWMIATLALPRMLAPFWPLSVRLRPEPVSGEVATEHDTEAVNPYDVALLGALGLLTVLGAGELSAALARAGWQVPSIIVLTVFALALAQIPAVGRLRGTRLLGMFAVYLFLAVIGAFCDLVQLAGLGRLGVLLLGFATILVVVHGMVTFGAARLLRIDPDVAAVASQANVGGGTTALALARSLDRDDLVLPAVLVGALGNALGTFLGFWVAGVL